MTLDRKQLACHVVGMRTDADQWQWCALNEDGVWLTSLDDERAEQAEKVGVYCCQPSDRVQAAAQAGLDISQPLETVAYQLFHPSDSDESAEILSRKVLNSSEVG